MNLIIWDIFLDKAEIIFIIHILIFVTCSNSDIVKVYYLSTFVYKSNYINRIIYAYIIFYTKKYVEFLTRMVYKLLYKLHK